MFEGSYTSDEELYKVTSTPTSGRGTRIILGYCKMKVGFLGLGKLGLPCALAIESKGHTIYGYDINPDIISDIYAKKLKYKEKWADELLYKSKIHLCSIIELVKNSEIIFVPIQTPHQKEY